MRVVKLRNVAVLLEVNTKTPMAELRDKKFWKEVLECIGEVRQVQVNVIEDGPAKRSKAKKKAPTKAAKQPAKKAGRPPKKAAAPAKKARKPAPWD